MADHLVVKMAYTLACLMAELKVPYMVDGSDHFLAEKKAVRLGENSVFLTAVEMVVPWDVAKDVELAAMMVDKSAAY